METRAEGKVYRNSFFLILVFLTLTLCVAVSLDVSIARQVVGFAFLTFLPGLCMIQFLGLEKTSKLEIVLLSIGLSIAFLMMSGFALNELASIGLAKPLSTLPLMIVLVGFTISCGVLGYKRKSNFVSFSFRSSKTDVLRLLPFGLVVLSIIGALSVAIYNDNLFLLLLLIAIPILFGMLFISKRDNLSGFYVVAVFVIALSLLFHSSFISHYIVPFGSDVPVEYAVSKSTLHNGLWSANPVGDPYYSRLATMLSITILPTFYSSVLNMDLTLLFKILFPMVLALVPLCLYALWKQTIGKKYAFAAAFLLIAQQTFFTEMLGVGRQIVAELFFALLLLVIFHKEIKPYAKAVLFVMFSFGLVVSHYAISEIFLVFIIAVFTSSIIFKTINKRITFFYVISFAVIMLSWYIFAPGSAVINAIVGDSNYVISEFGSFLNPASRGQTVLLAVGIGSSPTIWNSVGRIFVYATELLIVIGSIALLTKKVRSNFQSDYLKFTVFGLALLVGLILVPGLANTLNITRFYQILLFVLAPLFVLGVDFIATLIGKHKKVLVSILVVLILVPYFLFQTGFIYEVTKSDSWSISLSKNSMPPYRLYEQSGYIDAGSTFGAEWISKNINGLNSTLYSDMSSQYNVLTCYGVTNRGLITGLTNVTTLNPGGTVYLNSYNVNYETISLWNLTDLSFQINDLNKIYDNGQSQISQNQP
jgi:uncharacterized membrane protein